MRRVVIDTNVFVSALLSRRGASFQLLSMLGGEYFQFCLSVPLVLEYEEVAKRILPQTNLSESNLGDILDYMCLIGDKRQIYYLWRPFLRDPHDDMVLELAVAAECDVIITFNSKDFAGIEIFGVRAITPTEFLHQLGETS